MSPITTWEGAGNFAAGGSPVLWTLVTIVLLIVPVVIALLAENKSEASHKK